jgi:hypothetical protein
MILRTHVSASDVHVHHYINEILMSSTLAQCSVIYVCNSFDLIVFSATFSNINYLEHERILI